MNRKKLKLIIFIIFIIFPTLRVTAVDKFKFTNSNPKLGIVSVDDSYFNLKDYNLVTSIKNQYNTNACWAFATNASIESNLLLNNYGYQDLSEAHLELSTQNTLNYSRPTFKRNINTGGNYHLAAAYLMNGWGAVDETYLDFNNLLSVYNLNSYVNEDLVINAKPQYDVNSIVFLGNNTNSNNNQMTCDNDTIRDIKEYLITNGALAASVYSDNSNVFKKYNYYDGRERKDINGNIIPPNQTINHGVTIVGWDDTISKDLFSTINPPKRDGAFIVKNSYGELMSIGTIDIVKKQLYNNFKNYLHIQSIDEINDEQLRLLVSELYEVSVDDIIYNLGEVYINIGNTGYEYISYDDLYICNNVTGFFDVSNEVEDYTYYYDYLGYNATYNVKEQNLYLLNIFNKKSDVNEQLEEVSLYFPKVGQKYEVFFANGIESNSKNAIKIGEGESNFVGYNTLKINNKPIIFNDKYTILVKLTSEDDISLGVSLPINDVYQDMKLTSDVQFLSIDESNYVDATKLRDNNFQLTIKASTNETNLESNLNVHNNPPKVNSDVLMKEIVNEEDNKFIEFLKKSYLWIILGIIGLTITAVVIKKTIKREV